MCVCDSRVMRLLLLTFLAVMLSVNVAFMVENAQQQQHNSNKGMQQQQGTNSVRSNQVRLSNS